MSVRAGWSTGRPAECPAAGTQATPPRAPRWKPNNASSVWSRLCRSAANILNRSSGNLRKTLTGTDGRYRPSRHPAGHTAGPGWRPRPTQPLRAVQGMGESFGFEDAQQMRRHLPRLAGLHLCPGPGRLARGPAVDGKYVGRSPSSRDDAPAFPSGGHLFVFACAECGARLTTPLSQVALPTHVHQKYGNGLQLPVLMESGTFAVDPEPWGPPWRTWEEIDPDEAETRGIYAPVYALSDGAPGAIVIAPGDARGTQLIPEKGGGYCCGLDGVDGPPSPVPGRPGSVPAHPDPAASCTQPVAARDPGEPHAAHARPPLPGSWPPFVG